MDLTENVLINISIDFKQVIFLNGEENFLIEDKGTHQIKKNLDQTRNRSVRFIKSFEDEPGFYFVSCGQNGTDLWIQSSSQENLNIKIVTDIEALKSKIFDFDLILKKDEEGRTHKEIRMINYRDDDFMINNV